MSKALGKTPYVGSSTHIENVEFGYANEIGDRCQIVDTQLGDYSYICDDTDVINTTIGKFCSIAAHNRINPGNHPMDRVAMHHFSYRSELFGLGEDETSFFQWRKESWVTIGHDVWIGHGTVILPGVTVGSGAVIAAGAVVSKDVEPFTIVAGVSAKPIRKRFSEPVIAELLKLSWWDWPHEQLKAALLDFRQLSAEDFIEKYR